MKSWFIEAAIRNQERYDFRTLWRKRKVVVLKVCSRVKDVCSPEVQRVAVLGREGVAQPEST